MIAIIRTVVSPKEPIAAPNPPDVGDGMIEVGVEVDVELDDGVAFDEVGVGGICGVGVDGVGVGVIFGVDGAGVGGVGLAEVGGGGGVGGG